MQCNKVTSCNLQAPSQNVGNMLLVGAENLSLQDKLRFFSLACLKMCLKSLSSEAEVSSYRYILELKKLKNVHTEICKILNEVRKNVRKSDFAEASNMLREALINHSVDQSRVESRVE